MARRGMNVIGVDAREENLKRARFVARAMGIDNVEYREGRVETLSASWTHLPADVVPGRSLSREDPMRCLREVAAVTGEMCVVETQVVMKWKARRSGERATGSGRIRGFWL